SDVRDRWVAAFIPGAEFLPLDRGVAVAIAARRGDARPRDPGERADRGRPDPAGQSRPAARRSRLPGAGQLPAGAAIQRARQARPAVDAPDRFEPRRGLGKGLRLYRAIA